MMLKALPLVHFWSVLLLKEQMMTSVRKTLKTLVSSAQNRSISSEICPENNHKIGRFLLFGEVSDFSANLSLKIPRNLTFFPRLIRSPVSSQSWSHCYPPFERRGPDKHQTDNESKSETAVKSAFWSNVLIGLDFIHFCFKLIIIHIHTTKHSEIKFRSRLKLNQNIDSYKVNRSSVACTNVLRKHLCMYHLIVIVNTEEE